RRELRPFGVHVAIVEPGYFRTGMTDIGFNLRALEQAWQQAPAGVRESYGQRYYESLHGLFAEQLRTRCSSDLALVTGCMEHALTAAHPRSRYAAGWDARLRYIPISYLPTALADWL
ncbi:H17B6 dehydrogenase, partial [Nothoprocta ornata]|nr:H17B6 dehydrogenase [Nothoprocta ornata]